MITLPDRPHLDHLKKQAKDLLRRHRQGDPDAIASFQAHLPAVSGLTLDAIRARRLHLHDAQSCIARQYGFASWPDLAAAAAALSDIPRGTKSADPAAAFLTLVYPGEIAGTENPARPHAAARLLQDHPGIATLSPHHACAAGRIGPVQDAVTADHGWANRPGGPLNLPPLLAVAHSSLLRLDAFRPGLHACARLLIQAGADPNLAVGNRFPPASLAAPDAAMPLSALYGAAGSNRDPDLTAMLLQAGADPNDGESLYHALESPDCTRLLLEHGARAAGSNALYRALDLADPSPLELLLVHGADPNEPARNRPISDWGSPLLWAIRRRRSPRHIEALLRAGADAAATTPDGTTAHRLAELFGLTEVAGLLSEPEAATLSPAEAFAAACARSDAATARSIQSEHPGLPGSLPPRLLRLLPDLAAENADDAVRLMVALGWPIEALGGDWNASALNHAVFRGNAPLTRFLLEHHADWRASHGFGSDALGTLSWASCNQPVEDGNWPGCARALRDHGIAKAVLPVDAVGTLSIDGRRMAFSDAVIAVLLGDDGPE